MSMRTLVIDIETSPALKWGYGMFNQNYSLEMIHTPPGIIGWATAWEGDPARDTQWYDGPALRGYVDDLDILWDQLNEATHVEHFNGKTFDVPWVNHEFIKYGIAGTGHRKKPGYGRPPSPYKQIDLLKQVRPIARNLSNKLQWMSTDLFNLEGKIGESALTLWIAMYEAHRDQDGAAYLKAWQRMRRYCIQDVNLLPKMKKRFLPWMKGINANLYNGNLDGCPNCDNGKLQKRGSYESGAGVYQRYYCTKCGTWSKGNQSLEMSTVRNAS